MSFSVPKNVPSFNNPQRGLEDGYWGSSGISRIKNGHTGNGIGGKLDAFFDKRQLPMYKDKPYKYSGSRKSTGWYQRRRTFVVAILGILGLAYWFGIFPSVRKAAPVGSSGAAPWTWGSTPGSSKVNWDDRRQKVKEAFVLSWDGYEKHAWGMFVHLGKIKIQDYMEFSTSAPVIS